VYSVRRSAPQSYVIAYRLREIERSSSNDVKLVTTTVYRQQDISRA
jgi:hypothetical protein